MAKPIQRIVVARYKADINWLGKFPAWKPVIIQKQTKTDKGDMPNVGREPGAFCHAIIEYYSKILPTDIWAFVQDSPFEHCLDLELMLSKPTNGFQWLGDKLKETDGDGRHDHPNLPVAEYYQKWTGKEWKDGMWLKFAPGGQFMITGRQLLAHSRSYYEKLLADVSLDWNAWIAERLWESIFTEEL